MGQGGLHPDLPRAAHALRAADWRPPQPEDRERLQVRRRTAGGEAERRLRRRRRVRRAQVPRRPAPRRPRVRRLRRRGPARLGRA
ncbi:MAG: hypothetical protein EXS13_11215 [Planctomycetes bacterium]|nr:hypothetical protein [Planctomycetota bacterium]